jgi:hypothetical protein
MEAPAIKDADCNDVDSNERFREEMVSNSIGVSWWFHLDFDICVPLAGTQQGIDYDDGSTPEHVLKLS